MTKLLVVVLIISVSAEVMYIIAPKRLKAFFVSLDRSSLVKGSRTGHVAFVFGIWACIMKISIYSDNYKQKP